MKSALQYCNESIEMKVTLIQVNQQKSFYGKICSSVDDHLSECSMCVIYILYLAACSAVICCVICTIKSKPKLNNLFSHVEV